MGWLRSISLLSVLLGCTMVAAQYEWNTDTGKWATTSRTTYPDGQSSNRNSYETRYKCSESNLQRDCVFYDVSIHRHTSNIHFGFEDLAFNNQTKLAFKNSTMRKLPATLLGSFPQIEQLDLRNLQIEVIEPFALTNGINIQKLDMSFNVIRELPNDAFGDMNSLKELVLDRNELISLPEGIFSGKSNLTSLSITNNELDRIGDSTFKKCDALKNLLLSGNKLTHIDLTLIPSLFYVNVSSNLLTKLSVPMAVNTVDASHNRINTVTGPRNSHLANLCLEHNNLTDTTWIVRYPKLENVDLSYNELDEITYKHFSEMKHLQQLNLSNNRLVQLNLQTSIPSLKMLDVSHNHLLYVVKNQDQFDKLEELYLDHNSIVTLTLSSNNTLQRLTLSHNDWDCSNLAKLFINVNRSVVLDSDKHCSRDYQLDQDLCCKTSEKPYLDRLIQYIFSTSLAEKFNRGKGRCSVADAITSAQDVDYFVTEQKQLLQNTPQREAEIIELHNDIRRLNSMKVQFEQTQETLHNEAENDLRRYRVIKQGWEKPEDNLRKVYEHLNARHAFKTQETANRVLEAQNKKTEEEALENENETLKNLLIRKKGYLKTAKSDIRAKQTEVQKLEANINKNPLTRRITK